VYFSEKTDLTQANAYDLCERRGLKQQFNSFHIVASITAI
jgi:hypothetical protein